MVEEIIHNSFSYWICQDRKYSLDYCPIKTPEQWKDQRMFDHHNRTHKEAGVRLSEGRMQKAYKRVISFLSTTQQQQGNMAYQLEKWEVKEMAPLVTKDFLHAEE